MPSTQVQRLRSHVSIAGEDTPIRRALPHAERHMIGAWCFLDHAGPVQFGPEHGLHVGAHPHIGLQTFTWMIEGEVVHRDSLGNERVIRPGQVNLMTAGRGLAHTEDSHQDGTRLHAAQLWIALPDSERNREPAFENYPTLPRTTLGGFSATVLAGTSLGLTAPTRVYSPMVGLDLVSEQPTQATLPIDSAYEHGVMVLRGSASIQGETLEPGELLYFPPGPASLELSCDGETQLLIVGGKPFGEDILLWWNFVARTEAELETALAYWQAGDEHFGVVKPGSPAARLKAPALPSQQPLPNADGAV